MAETVQQLEMVGDVRRPDVSEIHIRNPHQHRSGRATPPALATVVMLALSTLALDQLSKRFVIDWLGPGSTTHRWELAGEYLAFEYVENTGAAFGLFAGRGWLLSTLAIVVVVAFLALFRSAIRHDRLLRGALGLVVGGAAGNVLDRMLMGHVTDFIAVGPWPKFNVADSAITVGLALIAATLLREREDSEESCGKLS